MELEKIQQSQLQCPHCKAQIGPALNFCPICGKRLKDEPLTIGKQIWIYVMSLLLPPLGLWPAVKYISHPNHKEKVVGFTALALTVISIVVTIFLTVGIINTSLKSATTQLDQLQNLQY